MKPAPFRLRGLSMSCLLLVLLPAVGLAQEMIPNGGFDGGTEGWRFYVHPANAEAKLQRVPRDGGACAQVTVTRSDAHSNVQFWAAPLSVREGRHYALTFEARAKQPTPLQVSLLGNSEPWGRLGLVAVLQVVEQYPLEG